MKLSLVGVVLVGFLSSGCVINAEAQPPNANILGEKKTSGKVLMDLAGVPEEKVCSEHGGLKDFCVTKFRSAIDAGLKSVISTYVRGASSPQYKASFRLVEFSHSPTSGVSEGGAIAVKVAMRWQFELAGPDGKPIVQLAETTEGPEQLVNVGASDEAVQALLEAVVERVAKALSAANWHPAEEKAQEAATDEVAEESEPAADAETVEAGETSAAE